MGRTFATADIADLRRRPAPDVWSPLEYACHTRDVIAVFKERPPSGNDPGQQLGWWDHDAVVVDSRYNEQESSSPRRWRQRSPVRSGTSDLAPAQWDAAAERRPGERFIEGWRAVLHEMVHHRRDAEQQLEATAVEWPTT